MMPPEFINLTAENLADEHLCCIIRSKKLHPGVVAKRQRLSDQSFAKKFGFEAVDATRDGYELLALSFDGTKPKFTDSAKKQTITNKELTIYYSPQCPFIAQNLEKIKTYCEANGVPVSFILTDALQKAKELPCVFNNWAVFYQGRFETVNLIDAGYVKRLLKK